MTYEFCLEYGTYPLKDSRADLDEENEAPDFIKDNQDLVEKIERLNDHFHQLFLVIESQFFFVGHDKPDILDLVKKEHAQIITILTKDYPDEDIRIEKCYWE
ncbi:hypothetical protein [Streptococcus thoraltensis]|uniref:hypothetical protein n=1 Tax=Streptococcus thoraltensis TaxID=55085 RepID=UPI0003623CFC|nr:hypothetical protein [Streptococcus thoraltensis]MDY4760657.1 hypothetical protein [Streptococcus thoraltensis]